MSEKRVDLAWKAVLLEGIDDALLFFMPELAEARDTSQATELLNNEMPRVGGDSDKGMRIPDVVFSIPTRGGGKQRVTFVIEQQHEHDERFALRMFEGFYRAADRMQVPVTSLAIFTGSARVPLSYEYVCFGTQLSFRYNSYRVADADTDQLRRDERVFAVVVLAAALMLKAGGRATEREKYARELLQLMRERGYTTAKKKMILDFVGRVFRVRDNDMSEALKEEWNMQAIPLDKAIEEIRIRSAYEEGKEEGKDEGKVEVALKMKSCGLPLDVIEKTTGLSRENIASL